MARRRGRFRKARAAAGRFFRGFKRRKSYSGATTKNVLLGAAIYGLAREKVAVLISPMTDKIPFLSQYGVADEAVLGLMSYMLAKRGNGIVKSVGQAGMVIESARVAEQALKGFSSNGVTVSPNGYTGSPSQGAYTW